jgi:hypothetical protein
MVVRTDQREAVLPKLEPFVVALIAASYAPTAMTKRSMVIIPKHFDDDKGRGLAHQPKLRYEF